MHWRAFVRTKRFAACVTVIAGVCALYWPVDLTRAQLSPSLLASDGRLLRAYAAPDGQIRLPLTRNAVDPLFIKALVGYEDRRFYLHPGVDPFALLRAGLQWLKNGTIVSGGSTLTMQVARLLSPGPRTVPTKIADMARALRLTMQYSKTEILNLYLILAPYGGNIAGLRAASLVYFDKEPNHLSVGETALLVVLPQNPNRFRPDRFPADARLARNKVLQRLYDQGVLTPTAYNAGLMEPLPTQRTALPFHAPHLADHLIADAQQSAPWHSTLDATLQRRAEHVVQARLRDIAPQATMAVLVVDNRTHHVKAYIGSADYFAVNRAGQIDMVQAIRSPGSTLKPFLYSLAFQDGVAQPETIIRDVPTRFGTYTPSNFNQAYQGDVSIRAALQQSLNVPAVKILNQVGVGRWLSKMRASGLHLTLPNQAATPDLPVILGGVGCDLWDLVQSYSGLANGGRVNSLTFLSDQTSLTLPRLMDNNSAAQVTDILTGTVLNDGTMRSGATSQLAIKTGTSYGYRDAWAIGYTPFYTIGVWVGRADGSPSPGQIGRNTAIPVLLNIYDLLPIDTGHWAFSPGQTALPYQQLPPSLQHWIGDRLSMPVVSQQQNRPLLLSYPVNDSVFRLTEIQAYGVKLIGQGGVKPYHWYVNGTLLTNEGDNQTIWRPTAAGYYKIILQDNTGRIADGHLKID